MNLNREDLRAALRDYGSLDPEYVVEFLVLLDAPGDVTASSHYVPGHLTASGFVMSSDAGAVALIHHHKLQRWLQPGGHLEPSDVDLESAARREIQEEVGLSSLICHGVIDIDVHTFPKRNGNPEHLHFDIRYAFRTPEPAPVRALDGVTDARWVPFDELLDYATERSVTRPFLKMAALAHGSQGAE